MVGPGMRGDDKRKEKMNQKFYEKAKYGKLDRI